MSKHMLMIETKKPVKVSPTEAKALYENGKALFLSKNEFKRLTELPGINTEAAANSLIKDRMK